MKKENSYDISFDDFEMDETLHGIENKVWINCDGESYLYKFDQECEQLNVGEVFVSKLCEELNVKCVKSRFAHGWIGERETHGCLIKSYRTPDVEECFSLETAQMSKKLSSTREYTPEYIFETVKKFVGDSCEVDENMLQELKIMALFDYLIVQIDRHNENIEFLKCKSDGKYVIRLAPMYDNGRCFDFINEETNEYFDAFDLCEQQFVTGETQCLIMNDTFYTNDSKYTNVCFGIANEILKNKELKEFYIKLKKFDMAAFVDEFCRATGARMSRLCKSRIIGTWQRRIEHIDHALKCWCDPKVRGEIKQAIKPRQRQIFAEEHGLLKDTHFHIIYIYNKMKGLSDEPLSKYIEQDREFHQQVQDWIDCKTDVFKTKKDFPLLQRGDMTRDEAKKILRLIKKQQDERFEEKQSHLKKLKSELEPDVFLLDLFQQEKGVRTGKSNKTLDEVHAEIQTSKKNYSKKCEELLDLWVEYGDDYCPKPELCDLGVDLNKQYDEDVYDRYIEWHEKSWSGVTTKPYLDWLKKIDKVEYAECCRNTLGERGWK